MDFTNCKRIKGRAYNGANGKKISIEYNGKQYMLKFPPSGKDKPTDLSYTNSCFSEHIGSSIFNLLGIEAQNTILGTFTVAENEKIVCACEDFTADGSLLFDFCSIKNTIIDSEREERRTELEDILETIEKQQFVDSEKLLNHFWDTFIVDAFLGNFDRHNGNWGFLYNPKNEQSRLAPVFDCGSCLLPQADAKVMEKVLVDEDEMNARIYRFPTSAIHLDDRKINYYDFLSSGADKDCNKALYRIMERIDFDEIDLLINNVEYASDLQKAFYKNYIRNRYDKILSMAFRLLKTK